MDLPVLHEKGRQIYSKRWPYEIQRVMHPWVEVIQIKFNHTDGTDFLKAGEGYYLTQDSCMDSWHWSPISRSVTS